MEIQLEGQYLYKLNLLQRGPSGNSYRNTCHVVKNNITIDSNGNCFICNCDGWLPVPVGQVDEFDSFESVFESDIAQYLQKDIADKKYTYCSTELCGVAHEDVSAEPSLYINIDDSCNLQCPSCRIEKVMHTNGEQYDKKLQQIETIVQWLHKTEQELDIIMSGNGDPLASLICRPLLKNWPLNKHRLTLHTNGLLIEKQLKNQPVLDQVKQFRISIDAGSAEVYAKVRVGGNWETLIRNLDFVSTLNKPTELIFTVQNNNINDLENFCRLVEHYKFDGSVTQLDNWSTWGRPGSEDWTQANGGDFLHHDVLDKSHANYAYARQMIQHCMTQYQQIRYTPAIATRLKL